AVDDPQEAAQRPVEPPPRIGAEVGMLGDAGGPRRVGELQEQGTRPSAKQQHRLTVEPPRLGIGSEHPWVAASRIHGAHHSPTSKEARLGRWGTGFDPDRLATLETRMWKAYYRRQPARLFG